MLTRTTFGLLVAAVGFAAPALAALDHWDRPSCYIYVHGQCFKNGVNVCGDGYEWALNECDIYYPSMVGVVHPQPPKGFTSTGRFDPTTKTKIVKSFEGLKYRSR